jgi:DNA polymerase V
LKRRTAYAKRCPLSSPVPPRSCGHLSVFVQTNPFNANERQYSNGCAMRLAVQSDDTPELIGFALTLLDRLYRDGYRYKKAGVMMTELVLRDRVQTGLFDDMDRTRSAALMSVMDQINSTLGRDRLKFASQGIGKVRGWPTKRERLSPRYTTCWDDIPTAHC